MTPRLPETDVREILRANNCDLRRVCVLAVRGYYLDSMGQKRVNDRGVYDDAHFVVWPDGHASFQANTDPSGYRKGRGTGSQKGMAMLKPGIHRYGRGLHKKRPSFRQCERFTVVRDGNPPYDDLGFHGINWHSGGNNTTSSAGCQTNPPLVFNTVRDLIYGLVDVYKNPFTKNDWGEKVRGFDYVLIDEVEHRAGRVVVSNRYANKDWEAAS